MKDMHTSEECLELGFTLQRTPQKATNTCTGQGEAQAVPHTKTGPVTSATGMSPAGFPIGSSGCPVLYDPDTG